MTTRTKIIIAVVALFVLGGAAYWYFSKDKEKPEDEPADKPAPKTPEPKTVMARESSGYPNTSATMQDIPVISKVATRSEPVSFVKVAQNPPPRPMAPTSTVKNEKGGFSVRPSTSDKLSSNSNRPGGGVIKSK